MKQLTNYFLAFILVAFGFSACMPIEDMYDETFLIGKWEREYYDADYDKNIKEYYHYYSNYEGATWVPAEDVKESEAQTFTWEFINSELTHIHIMESGGAGIPKIYTVTKLTETTLSYKDSFGKSYTFTKVE